MLCGPGSNGGDGYVVARLLRDMGWRTQVAGMKDASAMPEAARANRERWERHAPVLALDAAGIASLLDPAGPERFDIVVDALYGIGLNRAPSSLGALCARYRAGAMPRRVAVDVPTGLCADSGRSFADPADPDRRMILDADLTVTFHAAKPGHVLAEGPAACGRLAVVDLGLPHRAEDSVASLVTAREVAPRVAKPAHGNKYDSGHALVLAGGVGRGGAARMAARGALRIGAGLVTVACPPAALIENAARLDAVMLRAVRDANALREMLGDARIDTVCAGPGLGVERAGVMLGALLGPGAGERGQGGRALVLDADALTALSHDTALMGALHARCVLTPHGGEFARLFPDLAARLDEPAAKGPLTSRIDVVREAASRAGCVVLLKGPDTVIAEPGGRARVNASAYGREAPWLATAGAGDVLAGLIAGLLARGLAPFDAAAAAAYLHVGCALDAGPGLIAEDLPERLPAAFRALGL